MYFDEFGSLLKLEEHLRAAPGHRERFRLQVLAYFSLKVEQVGRVSAQSLDGRTALLDILAKWQRTGQGVPDTQRFGATCLLDLKDATTMSTNPLLQGGSVQEMRVGGRYVLGVRLPLSVCGAVYDGLPKVFDGKLDMAKFSTSEYANIASHAGLRCADPSYVDEFFSLAKEYMELAEARAAEQVNFDPSGNQTPRKALGDASNQFAIVTRSSSFGVDGGRPSPVADKALEKSQCGEPRAKKRKGVPMHEQFEAEVSDKLSVLRCENWATLCCDKSVDGLITRIGNARTKLLDKMDVAGAAPLAEFLTQLGNMVQFGNVHKRGYHKSKKEGALLDWVRPLATLAETDASQPNQWHCTLKELNRLVDFHKHVAEGVSRIALKSLGDVNKVAHEIGDEDESPNNKLVKTIVLITDRVEKLVLGQVQLLKADKKKQVDSAIGFHRFLVGTKDVLPTIPKRVQGYADKDRNRAERLVDQVLALETLAAAFLIGADVTTVRKPWPSEVKTALANLQATPKTPLCQSLDSWAGSRSFLVKASSVANRSSFDDMVVNGIKSTSIAVVAAEWKPDMTFDNFIASHTKMKQSIIKLCEDMSKLTPAGYEEVRGLLVDSIGVVLTLCARSNTMMWDRVVSGVLGPLTDILKATPNPKKLHPVNKEQVQAASMLRRHASMYMTATPSWSNTIATTIVSLRNYIQKYIKPFAKDTFSQFEPYINGASDIEEACHKGDAQRAIVLKAALALSTVFLAEGTDKLESFLLAWPTWRSTGQSTNPGDMPFMECLLTIGRCRRGAVALEDVDCEAATTLVNAMFESNILVCTEAFYVTSTLSGVVESFTAKVSLKVFGRVESSVWEP